MSDLRKTIEEKIKELQEKLKSQNSYIADINNAIEKLKSDKETTTNNIYIINGAIQAYADTLNNITNPSEDVSGTNV